MRKSCRDHCTVVAGATLLFESSPRCSHIWRSHLALATCAAGSRWHQLFGYAGLAGPYKRLLYCSFTLAGANDIDVMPQDNSHTCHLRLLQLHFRRLGDVGTH